MDILFELVLNFGFWIIILVGALVYTSINSKDKKKQKRKSQQNRKTIGQTGTNERPTTRDSMTTQRRNTGEQSRSKYSSSEHSESRKDYLERLREQYQQSTSDSTSDSQNTDKQIGREKGEKATQYRKKRKRKSKRRKAAIEDYFDTEPSELENARSSYRSIDKKKTSDLPAMNPKNLRQAIVMKEILDKPKSMRK